MKTRGFILFRALAIGLAGLFLMTETFRPDVLHFAVASRTTVVHACSFLLGLTFLVQSLALVRQSRMMGTN